jgi:hypothetical protein
LFCQVHLHLLVQQSLRSGKDGNRREQRKPAGDWLDRLLLAETLPRVSNGKCLGSFNRSRQRGIRFDDRGAFGSTGYANGCKWRAS